MFLGLCVCLCHTQANKMHFASAGEVVMNFILSSFKTKKTKITKQDTHTHTQTHTHTRG